MKRFLIIVLILLLSGIVYAGVNLNLSAIVKTDATYDNTKIELQRGNTEFSLLRYYDTLIAAHANLKGFWKLESNLTDSSAQGNNGTATGNVFYSPDFFNSFADAVYTLGDGAYVLATSYFGDVDFKATAFSKEFLISFPSLSSYHTFGGIKPTTATKFGVQFAQYDSKIWVIFLRADSDVTGRVAVKTTTTALAINTPYHIVITYDGNGTPDVDTVKVTINNVAQTLDTAAANSVWGATNNKININALEGGGEDFKNYLSRVSIYDAVLSGAEITAHYNALSFDTSSPTVDPVFLVDSGISSAIWNFSLDDLNINVASEGGTVLCQWCVYDTSCSYNGSWLNITQWNNVATQTGRYKAAKCQFNSNGLQDASIDFSSFGVVIATGGQSTLMGGGL